MDENNKNDHLKEIYLYELIHFIVNLLIFFLLISIISRILANIQHSNSLFFQCVLPNFNSKMIDKFTMLVPSYIERLSFLKKFLFFTIKNPPKFLHEIIINWGSDNKEIEKLLNDLNNQILSLNISIRYIKYNDTTVNRRFLHPPNIKTKAFLSIDDDILINPNYIDFGYQIWKNHSNQIVGYTPRGISNIGNELKYASKIPSLILTGIAFLNPKLIDLYYDKKNKENCEFVKKLNNCEDILMNYILTKEYNLSAVFIDRKYEHLGVSKGLSTKKGHYEKRALCLNVFYKSFGVYPQPIKDIYKEIPVI